MWNAPLMQRMRACRFETYGSGSTRWLSGRRPIVPPASLNTLRTVATALPPCGPVTSNVRIITGLREDHSSSAGGRGGSGRGCGGASVLVEADEARRERPRIGREAGVELPGQLHFHQRLRAQRLILVTRPHV